MADQAIQFEVAESCLSHSIGNQVYQAYQRSDFLEQRKRVHELWCHYVYSCAESAGLIKEIPELSSYR